MEEQYNEADELDRDNAFAEREQDEEEKADFLNELKDEEPNF